jgi:hypothetical protein
MPNPIDQLMQRQRVARQASATPYGLRAGYPRQQMYDVRNHWEAPYSERYPEMAGLGFTEEPSAMEMISMRLNSPNPYDREEGVREVLTGTVDAVVPPGLGMMAYRALKNRGLARVPHGTVGGPAYHGSRHEFDAFDYNKIGTGEGVQAYGRGLYFAENPAVAGHYRTAGEMYDDAFLGPPRTKFVVDGETIDLEDARDFANAGPYEAVANAQMHQRPDLIDSYREHQMETMRAYEKALAQYEGRPQSSLTPWEEEYLDDMERAISGHRENLDVLEGLKTKKVEAMPRGNLYEVDIPDEQIDLMLDWDKPLSQQPDAVRAAIAADPETAARINMWRDSFGEEAITGEKIYEAFAQGPSRGMKTDQAAASAALRKHGVPGIKFLDGTSRKAGEGSRNFVTFHDDIPIVARNQQRFGSHGSTSGSGVDPDRFSQKHHIAEDAGVGAAAGTKGRRYMSGERMGQYVGAPPGVDSPQKLAAMKRQVADLARAGEPGRFWYEESGQAINRGFSGDQARTKAFTGGLAITSPSTNVSTNTNFGILGYNQAQAGDPIKAGIFPGPMSPKLERVLNEGDVLSGRKVSSFYGNILHNIDPDIPQGVTADMWMARAFGMPNDKLTNAQFDFIERHTDEVAQLLNRSLPPGAEPWDKKQVQAAVWSAMKSQKQNIPIDEASKSFAHGLSGRMATVPHETMPGKTGTVLPRLHSATPDVKQQFHDDMNTVLMDQYGNDTILRELGALQAPGVEGTGVYEGLLSPVTSSQAAVARAPGRTWQQAAVDAGLGRWVKKKGKWGEVDQFQGKVGPDGKMAPDDAALVNWHRDKVDDASRKILDAAAATKAKMLNQDAGAWTRVFMDRTFPKHSQDAAVLKLDLTPEQVGSLETGLARAAGRNASPYPSVRTPDGYAVINPGPPGGKYEGFENMDFQKHLRKALEADTMPDAEIVWGAHDGNYFANDWATNPAGEAYDEVIRQQGAQLAERSGIIQERLRPQLEGKLQEWGRKLE